MNIKDFHYMLSERKGQQENTYSVILLTKEQKRSIFVYIPTKALWEK